MQQQTRDAQENLVRREARAADQRVSVSARYTAWLHTALWATFIIIGAARHAWVLASPSRSA